MDNPSETTWYQPPSYPNVTGLSMSVNPYPYQTLPASSVLPYSQRQAMSVSSNVIQSQLLGCFLAISGMLTIQDQHIPPRLWQPRLVPRPPLRSMPPHTFKQQCQLWTPEATRVWPLLVKDTSDFPQHWLRSTCLVRSLRIFTDLAIDQNSDIYR